MRPVSSTATGRSRKPLPSWKTTLSPLEEAWDTGPHTGLESTGTAQATRGSSDGGEQLPQDRGRVQLRYRKRRRTGEDRVEGEEDDQGPVAQAQARPRVLQSGDRRACRHRRDADAGQGAGRGRRRGRGAALLG